MLHPEASCCNYCPLTGRHGAELASQQLLHRGGINLAAGLAGIVAGLWRSVQVSGAQCAAFTVAGWLYTHLSYSTITGPRVAHTAGGKE